MKSAAQLLLFLLFSSGTTSSTHAESPIAVGTGFEYAIGDYGGDTDIEFIFIPFLFFYQTGRWWTEVEIPWIQLKAPDDSITLGDGSVIVGKKPRFIQGKATRPCTDTGNVP